MSLYDDVVAFFVNKGWTSNQAKGIYGNLFGESSLNPAAVGDGGKAYGVAQWHPDRQSIFSQVFGKSIKGSTLEEQLSFVDYELRNNEKKAGGLLGQTKTVEEATRTFMEAYERPANSSSLGGRIKAAMGGLTGNSFIDGLRDLESGLLNGLGLDGNWWTNPKSDPTDLDPTGTSKFLKSFFTGEMAARFSAVIIGVILIGLAIAAFVLLSDTTKQVVQTVKPV